MPSFTYEEDDQQKKFYEEPGEYALTIKEAEFGNAASSGNELLKLKMETENGVTVYDNLVFTKKAYWKVVQFLQCFTPDYAPKVKENFDFSKAFVAEHILGATGKAMLINGETSKGRKRSEVGEYVPGKKGGQPAGTTTKPKPATTTSANPTTNPTSSAAPKNPTSSAVDDDDEIPF